MKMNTRGLNSLEINLDELTKAFKGLLNINREESPYAVKFALTDDYGGPCERILLFRWNQEDGGWELDAKAHDLFITS